MANPQTFYPITMLKAPDFRLAFGGNARPMKVNVDETGKLMRHPLEDGSKITDHLVFEPNEITIPVMIQGDYRPVVEQIRQSYRDGVLFTITTRAGVYRNMALSEMPHEETTDAFDVIVMTLKFGEAVFIKTALGAAVKSKKHAKTAKRGQVQSQTTPTTPRGSFLFRHLKVR
jgi:hypothetical protein